jgi:hypothetical protein
VHVPDDFKNFIFIIPQLGFELRVHMM